MKAESHMQMMQMLNDVAVNKYVSHEELEVSDEYGNKMEIKFYPNEEKQ